MIPNNFREKQWYFDMIDANKIDLHMHSTVSDGTDTPEELIHAVMTNTEMWGTDLTAVEGFEEAAARILKTIREEGALKAFADCLD